MPTAVLPDQRDITASRLLRSAERHSFDPRTDVDWDAPPVPGLYYSPPERSSLYGTDLWQRMSEPQRVELTKHEVASIAAAGVWFEMILMQMLLRRAYDGDPTSPHLQFALTEIGDECRHSTMFGRMISTLGCVDHGRPPLLRELARLLKSTSDGPVTYAATLVAEEVLDALQREAMGDERVQPLVRRVSQIHVVEEARHVRFAREEVQRMWPKLNAAQRALDGALVAVAARFVVDSLIHPGVYAAAGLDGAEARAAAAGNPAWRRSKVDAASKVVAFLTEVGVITPGPTRRLWRQAGLLA